MKILFFIQKRFIDECVSDCITYDEQTRKCLTTIHEQL